MEKILCVLKLASFAVSLLVLTSCGGGGGGASSGSGSQPTATQAGVDQIVSAGDGVYPDGGLVIVTLLPASASATQVGLFQSNIGGGTYKLNGTVPWVSQYTAGCAKGDPNIDQIPEYDTKTKTKFVHDNLQGNQYGFCAATSTLMAAKYLAAPDLQNPMPQQVGQSQALGEWIKGYAGQIGTYKGMYCGNFAGDTDVKGLAEKLGLDAEIFRGKAVTAEQWIKDALSNDFPVVAHVHYQGETCRKNAALANSPSIEEFYQGGNLTRSMQPCPPSTSNPPPPPYLGHWVLITEIDANTVVVHDPDPLADPTSTGDSRGGIRRYKKADFLNVLGIFPANNNQPGLVRLSKKGKGIISTSGFVTTEDQGLSANQTYTASNTTPIVTPVAPNPTFLATGLPPGLSMDTEGRLNGQTAATGIFSVAIVMRSIENGIERIFNETINLTVKTIAAIHEALQFVNYSILDRAKEGVTYLKLLSVTGTTDAVSFNKVGGVLPPGLSLQNGQITGIPTQAGNYSFDIKVATSTSNITKTFTLVVDPAPAVAPPAVPPVLSAINPSPVIGMNGQQTVVLSGTGFSDGTRVELTDTTNGGIYQKVPVSINPAGTEITISANFTTSPATWSARILGPTGLNSSPLSFSVVAPVSTAPIVLTVSPSTLTAAATPQTITLNGSDFRAGAVVEVANLTTGSRTNASILTTANLQIMASYTFSTASMWGIRVINSDGTSSQSYNIQVAAPTTVAIPATPTAVSPGNTFSPGTVLANTTASLSWNNVASATYFAVAVRDLNSGALVVDTTVVGTSFALNFFSEKQYRWNVAACNSAGCSAYTAPLYFQTPGTGGSPDLVPQSISFPTSATAGSSITVNWTMANQGAASAATSNSVVRITTSSTSAAGTNLASIPTGTIAAGSSVNQSATVAVPSTAGTYYVWIIADNNSALTQSNAANDIVKGASTLTVSAASPVPPVAPCTVSFNASNSSIDASGGQRQVILTTSGSSCIWSATSNQSWVHNITPLSGTTGATLTYTVDANSSTQSRSATITAGQATLTVSQLGTSTSCTFSLGVTTQSVPANGGTFLEGLLASNQSCARTAQSNATFITNVSPASGNGDANISYTVAPNTSTSPRSGTLTIVGQTLIVNQDGYADTTPPTVNAFSVSPSTGTQGQSFTTSYTVVDSGGSGLKQIGLWRANVNGASNDSSWTQIGSALSLSGNSYSGTFTDTPTTAGNYWYGIHVIDNANPTVVVHESVPLSVTVTSSITSSCTEAESNDSSLYANPLTLGASCTGKISTSTDKDWFDIYVNSGTTITFYLQVPSGLDYDMALYGPSNTNSSQHWLVDGNLYGAGQPETITYTTTATGYFAVQIYGYAGASSSTSTYTITRTQ